MFSHSDFERLHFLEGQWRGKAPDGSVFFERYSFPDPNTFRSERFADSSDGSTVTFEDGAVMSRWLQFSWRATELVDGRACFEPVEAPSSFCWERVSRDEVRVIQRWTDAAGAAQQMSMTLARVGESE